MQFCGINIWPFHVLPFPLCCSYLLSYDGDLSHPRRQSINVFLVCSILFFAHPLLGLKVTTAGSSMISTIRILSLSSLQTAVDECDKLVEGSQRNHCYSLMCDWMCHLNWRVWRSLTKRKHDVFFDFGNIRDLILGDFSILLHFSEHTFHDSYCTPMDGRTVLLGCNHLFP